MDDLDTLVRRVDEDRWLASRFAPAEVRARLIAIYALNYEIAHAAESVKEAALGDMRLAWWRTALQEMAEGYASSTHPALDAFSRTHRHIDRARTFGAIVDARAADLEAQPFANWGELERYVDVTAGALLVMALEACGGSLRETDEFRPLAARAWGYTGLLRAAPYWRAKGRSALPREGGDSEELMRRAEENYEAARELAPKLPADVFPAFGYLATVPGYLRALKRGLHDTGLFGRKAAIIAASATGRI